jgi:hypothetical protein
MLSNDVAFLLKTRSFLQKQKAQKELLERQFSESCKVIEARKAEIENLTKARWLFSEAAKMTQERVKGYIEEVITMCIQSVFVDRPFRFLVDFNFKRNKSECTLKVQEGDKEPYTPKDQMGGGIIDVISIGLRTAMWGLENPKSNNAIFLDEPMKFVGKGEMLFRAGQMLREISHKLGIQLIINTHEPELAEIGDRSWFVSHDGVLSHIEQVGKEKEEARVSPIRTRKKE